MASLVVDDKRVRNGRECNSRSGRISLPVGSDRRPAVFYRQMGKLCNKESRKSKRKTPVTRRVAAKSFQPAWAPWSEGECPSKLEKQKILFGFIALSSPLARLE